MNIYVGNLPYSTTDAELEAMFAEFGSVKSAKVIMDRDTGRAKGFGFVEMNDPEGGNNAIRGLDGRNHGGRALKVNEARPREARPPRREERRW